MTNEGQLGSSFRDPSGFVYRRDGAVLRQVNRCYAEDYERLFASGLYEKLTSNRLLLPHEEIDPATAVGPEHYRTLRPEQLDFVSHPYEWCFSQLKEAALLTLRIQRLALGCGMGLKDASAYNVQFHQGRPVFVDTLSFERYREGTPWVAYRQFCQQFLAPLALMSRVDIRLQGLLRLHIDGVPLDLAASLLGRTWFDLGLTTHIKMHARFQQRFESAGSGAEGAARFERARGALPKQGLSNLVRDLESVVGKLDWEPRGTEWADYDSRDSYAAGALDHKTATVGELVAEVSPERVWDLGANTGAYSRLASETASHVVAFDADPACVERNYRHLREAGNDRVLPLLLDLVNPSPAIGFANRERESLSDRAGPDLILALALIHHIAISNNVPLGRIAAFLAELAPALVIEWVPKGDARVKTLLATREDVFPDYTREGFEAAFGAWWETEKAIDLAGSERTLYLLRRRSGKAVT